jgi:hypothetical protein
VSVPSEIEVRYDCPHCRAGLIADVDRWSGWRLCPACGRPGLPPMPREPRPEAFQAGPPRRGSGRRAEAWIASGDLVDPEHTDWRAVYAEVHLAPAPASRAAKVAVPVGLAIALFLLLVAVLDRNATLAGGSGLAVLFLFWARVRLGAQARRRW